jgi:alanine racemase
MNMDQCVVDLTDVGPVDPNADVEIISADADSPVALPRVAARSEVMPYELLCGLSARIPRIIVAGGVRAKSDQPAGIAIDPIESKNRIGFG